MTVAMAQLVSRLLVLIVLSVVTCAYAAVGPRGFVIACGGGPVPPGVQINSSPSLMRQSGYAAFTQLNSRYAIDFTLPKGIAVKSWVLSLVNRCQPQPLYTGAPQGLSARLIVKVNGRTVSSDNVIWGTDATQRFPVSKLLRVGSNHIELTLGSDSSSVLLLKSVQLGPPK